MDYWLFYFSIFLPLGLATVALSTRDVFPVYAPRYVQCYLWSPIMHHPIVRWKQLQYWLAANENRDKRKVLVWVRVNLPNRECLPEKPIRFCWLRQEDLSQYKVCCFLQHLLLFVLLYPARLLFISSWTPKQLFYSICSVPGFHRPTHFQVPMVAAHADSCYSHVLMYHSEELLEQHI